MQQAEEPDAYPQPTPRLLYVHDDLSDEVERRLGAASPATALTRSLFELLGDGERVVILTLAQQVERVIAQGPHAPFDLTLGIARAGERVAEALHAKTGWFPRLRRLGLTREEDGNGSYRLVSTVSATLAAQLEGLESSESLALVDDTIFSGLTMRGVLEALPPALLRRTHAFCLRGVAESIAPIARLCPVTVGVAAPGRMLEDVSFINASGLVLRVAIRRRGRSPLAFFERPDWIRAWFPGRDREVIAACQRLNALLEPDRLFGDFTAGGGEGSLRGPH
jgi:adenine/guanine phosphoribosyltransferase-like PRPP-binding protein